MPSRNSCVRLLQRSAVTSRRLPGSAPVRCSGCSRSAVRAVSSPPWTFTPGFACPCEAENREAVRPAGTGVRRRPGRGLPLPWWSCPRRKSPPGRSRCVVVLVERAAGTAGSRSRHPWAAVRRASRPCRAPRLDARVRPGFRRASSGPVHSPNAPPRTSQRPSEPSIKSIVGSCCGGHEARPAMRTEDAGETGGALAVRCAQLQGVLLSCTLRCGSTTCRRRLLLPRRCNGAVPVETSSLHVLARRALLLRGAKKTPRPESRSRRPPGPPERWSGRSRWRTTAHRL